MCLAILSKYQEGKHTYFPQVFAVTLKRLHLHSSEPSMLSIFQRMFIKKSGRLRLFLLRKGFIHEKLEGNPITIKASIPIFQKFSLCLVYRINYCQQRVLAFKPLPRLAQATVLDENESSRQVPERNFELSVLRKRFGPFSIVRKRKMKNRRSTVSFGKPRIRAQAKPALLATHAASLFFFPE